MLKNSVDKAAFDGFAEVLKSEYVKTGDLYILQHDEPAGELKRAKDRETADKATLKTSLDTTVAELTALKSTVAAMPSADTIKATAKAEAAAEYAPVTEKLTTREKQITDLLVEGAAKTLALTIGGAKNADALLPHITPRFTAKLDGDKPTVVVMKDGKEAPAMTLTELETEIRADKRLTSLVIVNQASGGAGRQVAKNTPAGSASDRPASLAAMSAKDLVAALPVPAAH